VHRRHVTVDTVTVSPYPHYVSPHPHSVCPHPHHVSMNAPIVPVHRTKIPPNQGVAFNTTQLCLWPEHIKCFGDRLLHMWVGRHRYYELPPDRRNPIVTNQIDAVSSEVFEGGYWLTANDEETKDEMLEFLRNISIQAGQTHQPFEELGRQVVTQYLVRGTFLGEKMMDSDGRHTGINPVNPTTMEFYTKAGTNVLVPPDHTPGSSDSMLKETDDGEIAAYVQFDEQYSRWQDRQERMFARDEILHWARKPDIGEARGSSAIEPVFERSRALREKFQDNDLAISMKAWPMVLFQVGSPDNPWTYDEMKDFMKHYKDGELGPGSFQAVPGDIDIHEFAGETADIESHIAADVDYIVSGLPGSKYSLGAFTGGNTNTPSGSVAGSLERQQRKRIRTMRRNIEELFTPYLRAVAESWGYDSSGLELHIGRPGDEVAPEDIQGNIIRYQSDANDEPVPGTVVDGKTVLPGAETDTVQDIKEERQEERQQKRSQPAEGNAEATAALASPTGEALEYWDTDAAADPRLVSTTDVERDLAGELSDLLIDARDDLVTMLEVRYGARNAPDADIVRDEFSSIVGGAFHRDRVMGDIEDALDETRMRTIDTLAQETHSPTASGMERAEYRTYADAVAESLLNDIRTLARELADEFSQQADRVNDGDVSDSEDPAERLGERVTNTFTEDMLHERTRTLVRMNLQRLINRCKLKAYRDAADVVGVELIAQCDEMTHPVVTTLAGCGNDEPVRALFADEERIGAQFHAALTTDPPSPFNPLPDTPPFYIGDTSEFAPVTEDMIEQ